MNTSKHTPGPWAVKPMGKQLFIESEYPSALTSFVCDMQFPDCQSDEERETAHANAHLIAAAPAMYEALQNLLEWAKGNRGIKEGNPYCKPEVRQALKVLASIQGKKDYLDADTASQAEGR